MRAINYSHWSVVLVLLALSLDDGWPAVACCGIAVIFSTIGVINDIADIKRLRKELKLLRSSEQKKSV